MDTRRDGTAVAHLDNLINRAEGLYLLRSSGNRIAGNTIRNHGAAGIYVKDSARNIIEGNVLINDPLQLVYGSQQTSSNQVYNLSVRAKGGRPSVAFDFSASSGNLIIDSQAVNPTDHDIRATLISADNVFTRFSESGPLPDISTCGGVGSAGPAATARIHIAETFSRIPPHRTDRFPAR